MSVAMWTRRAAFASTTAAMLALAACAPVTQMVDTPKEGDTVAVKMQQPVAVRWANLEPDAGSWVLETPPKGALVNGGVKIQPAAAGARQLEVFQFTGAKAGEEKLTFAYQRKTGAPPSPDEHITVNFKVG